MVVTCEKCASQYRVREDKLPPSGGRIRCPSCAHVFIVRPPAPETAPAPPSNPSTVRVDDAVAAALLNRINSSPTNPSIAPAPPTPAPAPAPTPATEPAPNNDEGEDAKTWKLRLGGLTYAFHSIESLQQWLTGRDNLDDVKLTYEGEVWKPISEFPQVLTPQIASKLTLASDSSPSEAPVDKQPSNHSSTAPSNSAPQGNGGEGLYSVSNKKDIERERVRKARETLARVASVPSAVNTKPSRSPSRAKKATIPKQENKKKRSNLIPFIIIFVMLLGGTVALHAFGVVDFGYIIPSLSKPPAENGLKSLASDPELSAKAAEAAKARKKKEQEAASNNKKPDPTEIKKTSNIPEANPNIVSEEEKAQRIAERINKLEEQARADLNSDEREKYTRALTTVRDILLKRKPDQLEYLELQLIAYQKLEYLDEATALNETITPRLQARDLDRAKTFNGAKNHEDAIGLLVPLQKASFKPLEVHQQLLVAYEGTENKRMIRQTKRVIKRLERAAKKAP